MEGEEKRGMVTTATGKRRWESTEAREKANEGDGDGDEHEGKKCRVSGRIVVTGVGLSTDSVYEVRQTRVSAQSTAVAMGGRAVAAVCGDDDGLSDDVISAFQ